MYPKLICANQYWTLLSCSINFLPAFFEHEFVDYLKSYICMIKWALCYSPQIALKKPHQYLYDVQCIHLHIKWKP